MTSRQKGRLLLLVLLIIFCPLMSIIGYESMLKVVTIIYIIIIIVFNITSNIF